MPNLKIATTPFINSFKYNSFIFRIFLLLKNTNFHSLYEKGEEQIILLLILDGHTYTMANKEPLLVALKYIPTINFI